MLGHLVQESIPSTSWQVNLVCREKAVIFGHMILSHHYEPEFGSPKSLCFRKRRCFTTDMIDAKMFDMQDALEKDGTGRIPAIAYGPFGQQNSLQSQDE